MSTSRIVTDESKLRRHSEDATAEEAEEIIEQLKHELSTYHPNGIGLSAIQIGIPKNVFILDINGEVKSYVNPKLVTCQHPYIATESCLSFEAELVETIRYRRVVYYTSEGNNELTGLEAHAFQHEYDHLNGMLMFDRIVPEKYDPCFCGSVEKFKFCCIRRLK